MVDKILKRIEQLEDEIMNYEARGEPDERFEELLLGLEEATHAIKSYLKLMGRFRRYNNG